MQRLIAKLGWRRLAACLLEAAAIGALLLDVVLRWR
jgi:hypothetical protein